MDRENAIGLLAVAIAAAALGCARERPGVAEAASAIFSGVAAEWIDLSYAYDDATIFWPTAAPFRLEVVAAGVTPAGFYYAANNFCTAEHGGTHLDSPIHFSEGKRSTDRIPIEQMVGPAAVVDVSEKAAADPDYRVQVADLEAFESAHGRIPDGAIVLIRTGWGRYWPDRSRYLGTAKMGPEAVPELHFPGLHPDAARWIVESRRVDAVGIDTPSIDYGQSKLFESHQVLFAADIPAFENVASLERLPPTGSYVVALPMKIRGGTGGPLRIVGVVPRAGA